MRILYVARHDRKDNDDEGAITYALEQLGHEVLRVHEGRGGTNALRLQNEVDFILFNRWMQTPIISQLKVPRCFWYFDLVDSDDKRFMLINQARRIDWMNQITPLVTRGFMTDGDWVAKYGNGKLVHLPQGVDERVMGYGEPYDGVAPILFTGSIHHSMYRLHHIQMLQERYADQFVIVGNPDQRLHGRDLANLFASTKVVVAPLGLCTDRYWSNRVFLTLGLGGFLLHPYSEGLKQYYEFGKELVVYRTEEECFQLIDYYIERNDEREAIRAAGYQRTVLTNTYRHRCEVLVDHMRQFIRPKIRKAIPLK